MPKGMHPALSREDKKQKILAAMQALLAEGIELCGPTDIGRMIDEPWVRVSGVPVAGAIMKLLRELIDEGRIRRVSQGVRRSQYKLIEQV